MKPLAIVGVVVIALGIAGLLLGRFSYTTQEKVVELGPITASVDQRHTVQVPDILGVGAIFAGSFLLYLGRKPA